MSLVLESRFKGESPCPEMTLPRPGTDAHASTENDAIPGPGAEP